MSWHRILTITEKYTRAFDVNLIGAIAQCHYAQPNGSAFHPHFLHDKKEKTMHTSQELLDTRRDSQSGIEHAGLTHQGLLSSSLADIKHLKTGSVSEHFADSSLFTFADSTTNKSKRAAESPGNDLDVTVPKGTDVVIGGSNCHIDLKISPIGQIIITTKPGANCDVSFGGTSN